MSYSYRGAKLCVVKKKRNKDLFEVSLNAPIYTRKFAAGSLLVNAFWTVEKSVVLILEVVSLFWGIVLYNVDLYFYCTIYTSEEFCPIQLYALALWKYIAE